MNKRVTLLIHTNSRCPGIWYGTVRDATTGELLILATEDYCKAKIKERGWIVVKGN